jgi:hypothetical protein
MIGKGNISATIIADSISPDDVRITTFELEYPRFIHAEFMTHRLFSRNAASSRAIPVAKAIELVKEKTAMPIHWGKNQPGMSAKEECDARIGDTGFGGASRESTWSSVRDRVILYAEAYAKAGYHKQIVNRLLEPFTMIKVVVTATEYDNFFWLRNHPDAQPEIAELARVMWEEYTNRDIDLGSIIATRTAFLSVGDWHVPYYREGFWAFSQTNEYDVAVDDYNVTLEDALAISASCCAQVSYRKLDDSMEKARDIFKRLVESKPVHASPFEHQATPISFTYDEAGDKTHIWQEGITHQDRYNEVWSGNFRSWIQHRQLIPDHTCWKYKPQTTTE